MPQKCRICAHPKTKEMEEEYVRNIPKTTIARKYGVPNQSVDYHMDNHLPVKLVRSVREKEKSHAEDILSGINDLLNRTKDILDQAEEQGHKRLALDAIKEARGTYELLSKIAVKLEEYRRADEQKETNVLEQQISDGLQVLSDAELQALIQLMGKVHAGKPDYELDSTSRYIVEAMQLIQDGGTYQSINMAENGDKEVRNSSEKRADNKPKLKLRKNSKQTKLKDDFWDDDLDLEFDDLTLNDTIPSDDDDPKWMKEDRRRRGY